jgi:hypothetical protein
MHKLTCQVIGFALVALATALTPAATYAQSSVSPNQLGIVQAPAAGSVAIPVAALPPHVRHAAQVAFKRFDDGAFITGAQLDKDDVLGVYEVRGKSSDGRALEADIRPDGVIEELEVEIGSDEVPPAVSQALARFASGFTPAEGSPQIEKSIRPSDAGLSEIWYEFSGSSFDVEIRSDGRAVLIEPA